MHTYMPLFSPKTHTKRQATQHGCLPSLLGDGDKGIEIVMVRKKYFVLSWKEHPRQNKNLLYRHDKPNEPNKKGPLKQSAGATPRWFSLAFALSIAKQWSIRNLLRMKQMTFFHSSFPSSLIFRPPPPPSLLLPFSPSSFLLFWLPMKGLFLSNFPFFHFSLSFSLFIFCLPSHLWFSLSLK